MYDNSFFMHIDVQLLPLPPDPVFLSTRAVVVIDVLRATSVIVHALSEGAMEVIPVTSVEEALRVAGIHPEGTTLLGGEKNSQRVAHFDLGNSPREYDAGRVKGKRLVMATTNGTKAFHSVSSGREIMVGSFFNIEATARRCLQGDSDLLIFPSGDKGCFSLEDTVCGGMVIDRMLRNGKRGIALSDAAQAACILYRNLQQDVTEAFRLSHHGGELIQLGLGDDLPYCAQVDITEKVPLFRQGVIRIFD